jgi:hypothetical protein
MKCRAFEGGPAHVQEISLATTAMTTRPVRAVLSAARTCWVPLGGVA